MALTILLTSTGSSAPLRFLTRMPPELGAADGDGTTDFDVSVSVGAAGVDASLESGFGWSIVSVAGVPTLSSISVTRCSQLFVVASCRVLVPLFVRRFVGGCCFVCWRFVGVRRGDARHHMLW